MLEVLKVEDNPNVELPITSYLLSSAIGLLHDYAAQQIYCDNCKLEELCKGNFEECPSNWKKEQVIADDNC